MKQPNDSPEKVDPSSNKALQNFQPKLKKIRTRTTIVEQREDEDLVYEKIKDSRFKQQRLPAWRPVPTITSVIIFFIVFAVIFIILGIILLAFSSKVKSVEIRYDENCGTYKKCIIQRKIEEKIEKPVFIYYQLDGFFQNSRRYLQSKNRDQLRGKKDTVSDCKPVETNKELGFTTSYNGGSLDPNDHAIPCGLVAKSFFNDTYEIKINNEVVEIDETDISFAKDRDLYKQNIDLSRQWHDLTDEHFLVWMRPSGLPNPRKLWGKIDRDLNAGDDIEITIRNNYDVTAYEGEKKIILSNATIFGGKNTFLGVSYIVVGCLSLIFAILFPIGYKYQLARGNYY
jgi:hypothetical protein